MFIISLGYTADLAQIEAHLEAHRQFLDRHYHQGTFLFSGRKEPRSGGIIIARAPSREAIEALIQEDPFHRHGLADYAITEFIPTKTAPDLSAYAEG